MARQRFRLIAAALCLALSSLYIGVVKPSLAANSAIPAFDHVFQIVLENKETTSIIGSSSAPYLNSLAKQYGLATNYYGIRHPSLPNYLAMIGGDTFGVSTDCTTCFVNAPNLADQIEGAGKSWKAYIESMPKPCYIGDSGPLYRQKHNPFIYFDDIRTNTARCNQIVPLTQLDTDLQKNSLPNYVWITPNMCNSMHDCSVATGDSWVRTWVEKILASPAWQQNGVLFITFDEGSTNASCCTLAKGGQIVTLVISPLGRAAFQSAVPYDHYSLLRTIEDAWGLAPLANAGCSCTTAMTDFFGAAAPTVVPTVVPTEVPTATPTPVPTAAPTETPVVTPTEIPTETPVVTPTETITPTVPPIDASRIFTSTFGPRADAYVAKDAPATSYGNRSKLLAVGGGAEKHAFLTFSVTGLPADAQVLTATLRLTVVNDSTNGGQVYSISNTSWTPAITWQSQPAIDGPQLAQLGPVALNSVVEIDVSGIVKGNGEYSFAIVAPPGNLNTVGYASQRNDVAARRPVLLIDALSPTPPPAVTPSATETPPPLAAPLPEDESPAPESTAPPADVTAIPADTSALTGDAP